MRFDFLREPISEASPCGPDLDLEMDADYTNYMLLASGRLPSSFFDSRSGAPFDRSTIDLGAELKAIRGFLDQTRDARLVTLDARFHALRGEIVGFSEAIQGLALLVSTFWNDFHPQLEDGDIIFRMNAVEAVDDQVQVVLPLQFSSLTGSGRSGSVTLRNYLVASGEAPRRDGEEGPSLDMIAQIMGDDRQAETLTTTYEAVGTALTALAEIRSNFLTNGGTMPTFDRVVDVLKKMNEVIVKYRPELGGATEEEQEEEGEEGADGAPVARRSSAPALGLIKTHAAADAALRAAETYFLRYEPSNPAMVLVHQARLLIGRPMAEAMEALLPDHSPRLAFRFTTAFPFEVGFAHIREVTISAMEAGLLDEPDDEPELEASPEIESPPPPPPLPEPVADIASEETSADAFADGDGASADGSEEAAMAIEPVAVDEPAPPSPPPPAPPPEPAGPARFRAKTRDEASDLMQATEAFFKSVEPSSPIPVLIAKARNYLNKDFSAILGDLLPQG